MTTKQQERDALAKIRKIVEALGEDSYIGTAFKGCFENAETNIEWDAAFSIADELAAAKEETAAAKQEAARVAELTEKIKRLEADLEREQEWKPHESDRNVKQADYEHLATAGGTRILSDEEAIDLIASEFGFTPAKITILHSVDKEEINRHRYCRKVGEIDRQPCYNATDWNYIRFDVKCAPAVWYYEMHNGQLIQYYC
jgi:hypothetical protein